MEMEMEEFPEGLRWGRVSFTGTRSPMERLDKNGSLMKDVDCPTLEKALMEFLSRSWSPSSSDFFQILSSSNRLLPPSSEAGQEEHEKETLERNCRANNEDKIICKNGNRMSVANCKWAWLSDGKPVTSRQHNWINVGSLKSWLGGHFLSGHSRRSRHKRKEELRLQTAEIQAALSITQLAAAVAGMTSNSHLPDQPDGCNKSVASGGEYCCRMKTSQAVASAAALVATVCAEAAESTGARRSHVASAMRSGLAAQCPSAMLAVTARAATCLSGAAALKLRAKKQCSLENQEMLARGAQLLVLAPSGNIHVMVVSIHLKHDMLRLRLGKKCLRGVITRYKEYGISYITEEVRNECCIPKVMHDFYFFKLETTGGIIHLLFDDERHCTAWKSSISHYLLSDDDC